MSKDITVFPDSSYQEFTSLKWVTLPDDTYVRHNGLWYIKRYYSLIPLNTSDLPDRVRVLLLLLGNA